MNNKGNKASVIYLFATLFNKGIAFLTVPVFTRLLETSDYGIVTTYNSWVDILVVFLSLALYMAIRTAYVDFHEEREEFLNTVFTFTLCISAVVALAALFFGKKSNGIGGLIIMFAVVQGAAGAIIMDYQQYLMMDFKYIQRSLFMALPNLLAVIASIVTIMVVPLEHAYMGRIIPTMLIYLITGCIILKKIYQRQRPRLETRYLRYGLTISLPLVLHGVALNILSQSDRTMITVLADSSQTGIYSLVYNFGMIAAVLTMALDGVWLPFFMGKMKESRFMEINLHARNYMKFMTCAMWGLILVGPEIMKLLASPKYWEGVSIIPPIVLANYCIFAYTFFVNVEHYKKKTLGITINTVIAAVVNIGLNYMLIPKYGYMAAAYTTLVSYCVSMVLHAIASKRMEPEVLPIKIFIPPFIMLMISTVLYYQLLEQWFLRWVIAVGVVIIIAFFERKTIISYIGLRKEK